MIRQILHFTPRHRPLLYITLYHVLMSVVQTQDALDACLVRTRCTVPGVLHTLQNWILRAIFLPGNFLNVMSHLKVKKVYIWLFRAVLCFLFSSCVENYVVCWTHLYEHYVLALKEGDLRWNLLLTVLCKSLGPAFLTSFIFEKWYEPTLRVWTEMDGNFSRSYFTLNLF